VDIPLSGRRKSKALVANALKAVILIAVVVLAASACGGGASHYTADKTLFCLLDKYGITSTLHSGSLSTLHSGGWVAKLPSGHVRITFTRSHEAAELFNADELRAAKTLPPALRKITAMSVRGNVQLESNSTLNSKDRARVEGCLK